MVELELESVLKYLLRSWRVASVGVVLAGMQMLAYSEVAALTSGGNVASSVNNPEALELELFNLSQRLLQDPSNPQLLLQKGIYLSDLGRLQAAFDVFETLRQAFPDHPTPYNNLASIYARWGRLEEARQMLLKSRSLEATQVQTHLSIASVNIGLALDALNQARALKPTDLATQKQIRLLESYQAESNRISATLPAQEGTAVNSKPKTAVELQADKSKSSARASEKSRQRPSKGPQDRLTLDTLDNDWAAPAPAQAVAKPASPRASSPPQTGLAISSPQARQAELREVVQSWAKAWSQRNSGAYLEHYSDKFEPSDGSSRSAWIERKKMLLAQAKYIRVTPNIIEIQVTGDEAMVLLNQKYKSNLYADQQRKELRMQFEAGQWKIVAEK